LGRKQCSLKRLARSIVRQGMTFRIDIVYTVTANSVARNKPDVTKHMIHLDIE
jgi:hypothetical protein